MDRSTVSAPPATPLRAALAALIAAAALAATVPAAAGAAVETYVALGDSYTSGPLIPNQVGHPLGCARSDRNYPRLVRAAIGAATFRDASCSSATTRDMTAAQLTPLGVNPPQLDALDAGAELVTVGIGGNDVGLVGAAVTCLVLGATAPTGRACRSHFAAPGGGDRLRERIALSGPRISATLAAIRARAPRARTLLVGYPAVAPNDGRSCYPLVPVSRDDLAYFDGLLRATNAMLAERAAAADVEYVDTYDDSVGHDVCAPPARRWSEGVLPARPALPVHPNALGAAAMARSVLRVLRAPRPGPRLSALTRSRRTIPAGRGLRLSYTLSRDADVSLALRRSRGHGRYSRPLWRLRVPARAGANRLALGPRRIGRRPGLYRLTATPRGGAPATAHFRIRRAR